MNSVSNLRTQTVQIANSVNVQLTQIRQMEIDYFTQFYYSFGIQCAFLGSLATGCLAQTPGAESLAFYSYTFWIGYAFATVGGLFALLMSLFVIIYGQAFALRGPSGSMIKAINGMKEEQNRIVNAMSITFGSIAVMMCGVYLIMMDFPAGVICSGISLIGALYTGQYCVRIYNRFHFTPFDDSWSTYTSPHDESGEAFPSEPPSRGISAQHSTTSLPRDPLHSNSRAASTASNSNSRTRSTMSIIGSTLLAPLLPHGRPVSKGVQWPTEASPISATITTEGYTTTTAGRPKIGSSQSVSALTSATHTMSSTSMSNPSSSVTVHKGYLSMKVQKRFSSDFIRRYIVLRGSYLVYYNAKLDYESKPEEPLNKRAIDMQGYTLETQINESSLTLCLLPLSDELKSWEFRCDTTEELELWKTWFLEAIESS